MSLDLRMASEVIVVKLPPHALDDGNLPAVGEQFLRLTDEPGRPYLHLDFANVRSVGSMGLAKLVTLHKRVRSKGGRLTLVNVPPLVHQVLQVTCLDKLMEVRRKEE